jgi:hypothetical protein
MRSAHEKSAFLLLSSRYAYLISEKAVITRKAPKPISQGYQSRSRGEAGTTDPARLARLATFVYSPEVGYILRSRSGEYFTFAKWRIFYVREVENILRFGGGEYFALLRMRLNSNNSESPLLRMSRIIKKPY